MSGVEEWRRFDVCGEDRKEEKLEGYLSLYWFGFIIVEGYYSLFRFTLSLSLSHLLKSLSTIYIYEKLMEAEFEMA